MSKYTTEVRFICEDYAGLTESKGYDSVDEIIESARPKIFDFNYPIFDESYRKVLETKILLHYYTREICEETVGLWKLRLKTKMNEIMPFYNKLYESELIQFDPMYDTDYQKVGNRNEDTDNVTTNDLERNSVDSGTDTRQTNGITGGSDVLNSTERTGGSDITNSVTEKGGQDETNIENRDKFSEWNLYSDTPQGGIEGILGAENEPSLLDDGYLTNARHILHDGDGTTGNSVTEYGGTSETEDTVTYGRTKNGTDTTQYGKTENTSDAMSYGKQNKTTNTGDVTFDGNTTEQYAEHVFGKMPGKTFSKLLLEFRETFLNIDMDVINELRNLFFNLW